MQTSTPSPSRTTTYTLTSAHTDTHKHTPCYNNNFAPLLFHHSTHTHPHTPNKKYTTHILNIQYITHMNHTHTTPTHITHKHMHTVHNVYCIHNSHIHREKSGGHRFGGVIYSAQKDWWSQILPTNIVGPQWQLIFVMKNISKQNSALQCSDFQ